MTEQATDPPLLRIASTREAADLVSRARSATSAPVHAVGSTGIAGIEPLVIATDEKRTAFYYDCTGDRIDGIATGLEAGDLPAADAAGDAATEGLPAPESGPLSVGRRRLLSGCGWRRPDAATDYRRGGGFVSSAVDADAALDIAATQHGRGWGDIASGESLEPYWREAAEAAGDGAVVVNAHGSACDELLVSSDPFAILDGAAVAATAIGAADLIVYTAATAEAVRERAADASEAFPADIDVSIASGPDRYRAAEPTMAIEAIEGADRIEARRRPPGPASTGLDGRPTLVHTPRTLAAVAARGRNRPGDTRLLTVTGDVSAPATVELSTTEPIETGLEATTVEGDVKAVCVGGRFGGLTAGLDTAVGVDALASVGLGTEATLEVLTADRCLVAFAGKRIQWASETNCGRCVPCREGSAQLADLLREVYEGTVPADRIDELARVMERSSLCQFGRDVPRPARTALERFPEEFHAHAAGRCPAGVCDESAGVSG
jgi:NADH-quinone oxidoreductase subunit F